MLTFRNTNIVFTIAIAVLLAGKFFLNWPVWMIGVAALVYLLILFYGSYTISSGFYLRAFCAVDITEKKIALSFDDGPDEKYTANILEILAEYNYPATFFCIGRKIAGREKLVQQIVNAGHLIGNHSYSHDLWFSLFSAKKMSADLAAANQTIADATGLVPRLFRPPYGVTNPNVKKAVIHGGYEVVGWSIRSLDTVIKDEKKLLQKLTGLLHPGAVILLHDTSLSAVNMLRDFFKEIKKQGYVVERADKLLNLEPYA